MRTFLLAGFLSTAFVADAMTASLSDIPLKTIDGTETSLREYAGKVLLIVNVASQCGLTPQYAELEALYQKYGPQGFVILGFPCNDFGAQEPGSSEEIREFCSLKYRVTFPMFEKIHVKGPEQSPLYAALAGPEAKFPGEIKWNFGKFLVGKDGAVIARFEPKTTPGDPAVVGTIESALK